MKRYILMIALILSVLSTAVMAEVPPVISYQGKLMQPNGTPIPDGTYSVHFAIYDAPTGGDALWGETNSSVLVKGGLFAVLLGSVNNLGANILDSQSRYLGIKVGTDAELAPRQRIASVATALRAGEADIAKTVIDGAITTNKIADGAVTNAKLAPASIDFDKLSPSAGVPVGTILPFAGAVAPPGWMLCDGSPVDRLSYAKLFAAVGTAWGSGDGSTTFNIPDLRGKFLRGRDGGAGLDPDRAGRAASKPGGNTGDTVGSVQPDAFQGHYHKYTINQYAKPWNGMHGLVDIDSPTQYGGGDGCGILEPVSDQVHGDPRVSNETRPVNAYVNYIISAGR